MSPSRRLIKQWFSRKQLNDLTVSSKNEVISEKLLITYRDMFNKIIFKGLLNGEICPLTFVGLESHHSKLFGCSQNLRDAPGITPETMRGHIIIFELKQDGRPWAEQLRIYLGVMLHEMVHAFQCIYSCGCRSCEIEGDIFKATKGGHDVVFYALSGAIEVFMKASLGLEVSLHRYDSLKLAINTGALAEADLSKVDFSACSLDALHVGRMIEDVKDKKRRPKGRVKRVIWKQSRELSGLHHKVLEKLIVH
jgi:hypothetical protein